MSQLVDAPLQELAARVQQCYTDARHRRHTRETFDPGRWGRAWRNAARACAEWSVSPEELVQAAFRARAPYPHPKQLCSDRVHNWIVNGLQDQSAYSVYQCEVAELQHQMDRGRTLEAVLADRKVDISALFRWAMARKHGLVDVASLFLVAARKETKKRSLAYLKLLPEVPADE